MKIKKLFTQNIKRIKAVTISPQNNLVVIAGDNAQGKSSVIDSIIYALGGKDLMPENPIRDGQDYAQTVIDLGKLIAVREYWRNENGTFKHSLKLNSKDGYTISSPQGELDKLIGNLTFDPIQFEHLKEKEQFEILSKLVGYDEQKYATEIERLYQERKIIGRERDRYKAMLDKSFVDETWYKLPDEEISYSDLIEKNGNANILRIGISTAEGNIQVTGANIANRRKEIIELQAKISKLNTEIKNDESYIETTEKQIKIAREKLFALGNVSEEIKNIEITNGHIRAKLNHIDLENRTGDLVKDYEQFTQLIEETKGSQKKEIESLEMPINGLSLSDSKVYFKGIPYSQCSGAERLQIALSVTERLNKDLKIAMIKEGAILDDTHLEYIQKWADKNDIQVWIEIIDKNKSEIIIEDGEIADGKSDKS